MEWCGVGTELESGSSTGSCVVACGSPGGNVFKVDRRASGWDLMMRAWWMWAGASVGAYELCIAICKQPPAMTSLRGPAFRCPSVPRRRPRVVPPASRACSERRWEVGWCRIGRSKRTRFFEVMLECARASLPRLSAACYPPPHRASTWLDGNLSAGIYRQAKGIGSKPLRVNGTTRLIQRCFMRRHGLHPS